MIHEHVLSGCRPKPLAGYLKALGILRLLAGQKDPGVKGCWQGECFALRTVLSKSELEDFYCREYIPTPIVSPWNLGSGFYAGDPTEAIRAIAGSKDQRFASYCEVIAEIRSWPEMPGAPESPGDTLRVLRSEFAVMRPGKKRDEMAELLLEVEKNTPAARILGGNDPLEMPLVELESRAKALDSQDPNCKAFRAWWNTVKKVRTECNKIGKGKSKEVILPLCRSRLPEGCLEWVDALCALHADGSASYNPLLGTGGNEGHLEFSRSYMQRVVELLITGDPERTRNLLHSALYGTVLPGLDYGKIGQYDPGRAGGFNQGAEIETKEFKINPWDFVFTLEGSLVLSSALARRNQAGEDSQLASPFTVHFSPVGFASSEYGEKGRKEIWLPLWHNPASCEEVRYLFGEGRSTVGRKRARTGLDFSRAVGTLGVDRGISAFERYAFLERRGKSYVALPAGRLAVRYHQNLELLNEMDRLTGPLDRFFREFKNIPATYQSARRQIDEAAFECCRQPDHQRFKRLVCALGRMERLLALRDRSKKPVLTKPLYGLSPTWISQCDDGSHEVRIAASLASIQATGKVGPMRSGMAGVDPAAPWRWSDDRSGESWVGSNLAERLGTVLARRMLDAERFSAPRVPLEGKLPLPPHDVMPFLLRETDDNTLEDLLWGFLLIDWKKRGLRRISRQWADPLEEHPISRTWSLLKLLHTPEKVRGVSIRREPRIVGLLQAGRVVEACSVAIHRLRVSELRPFAVTYEEQLDPERLLSSLLISTGQQWVLESLVLEKQTATA